MAVQSGSGNAHRSPSHTHYFTIIIISPTRKVTQVPQPSEPMEHVADEAIHKELGDSLVRAATTASSLEAEHDNGNINKTQSKATPNESGSQATDLGGGLKGNTLRNDEDRMKLNELMELCTNLQTRVLDLEKTMTTQRNEIASLKRKNPRRIEAIDADEDITLVNDQDDADMFDVNDLGGEEVFVAEQEVVSTTTTAVITGELTLAQALEALKTLKPKDKGKGIMVEEPVKPKRKKQIKLDEEAALRIQDKFDEEERLQKVKDDKETTELKQLMEIIPNEEEVAINAIPLAVKSSKIVNWKIYKGGKKSYYQIIRADRKTKMYMVFSKMHESFDREDLEDPYKLVTAKFKSTRPVEDLDLLFGDAIYAGFHVGGKDISPYTTYTYNDAGKEASK
nr:hypothetical protein [Tanacetum cinerariifolium]